MKEDQKVEKLMKSMGIEIPKKDSKLHNFEENEVDRRIANIETKQSGKLWKEDKEITTGNDNKKSKKWFIKKF